MYTFEDLLVVSLKFKISKTICLSVYVSVLYMYVDSNGTWDNSPHIGSSRKLSCVESACQMDSFMFYVSHSHLSQSIRAAVNVRRLSLFLLEHLKLAGTESILVCVIWLKSTFNTYRTDLRHHLVF